VGKEPGKKIYKQVKQVKSALKVVHLNVHKDYSVENLWDSLVINWPLDKGKLMLIGDNDLKTYQKLLFFIEASLIHCLTWKHVIFQFDINLNYCWDQLEFTLFFERWIWIDLLFNSINNNGFRPEIQFFFVYFLDH